MTVESQYAPVVYDGNGVAKDFPFTFRCQKPEWIRVALRHNKKDTPLFYESNYSVVLLSDFSGGTVTLVTAPPTGQQVLVEMDVPITQESIFTNTGQFNLNVVEAEFDKGILIDQQLRDGLSRAVTVPPGSDETPGDIMNSLYQARDDAAGSATAAAASAAAALASEHKALGSAEESALRAAQSCACADRAEEARDVSIEQNALTNALMAVEMAKINVALAAGKDDNKASLAVAMAWAMNPLNVPVRLNPETGIAEYSALHWAEMARRAGLEEATALKFGIVKLASELSLAEGHPTDVVTAAQWKGGQDATRPRFDSVSGKFYCPGYIGQHKRFMLPKPPEGWAVKDGAWLDNANVDYPDLWANLHHPAYAFMVKTVAEYNALSAAAGGVGGVMFFAVDVEAKRVRLPDTRGDYDREAGSAYLQNVGQWHGDAFQGHGHSIKNGFSSAGWEPGGFGGVPIYAGANNVNPNLTSESVVDPCTLSGSSTSRVAVETRTRTHAKLGCVCVKSITAPPATA